MLCTPFKGNGLLALSVVHGSSWTTRRSHHRCKFLSACVSTEVLPQTPRRRCLLRSGILRQRFASIRTSDVYAAKGDHACPPSGNTSRSNSVHQCGTRHVQPLLLTPRHHAAVLGQLSPHHTSASIGEHPDGNNTRPAVVRLLSARSHCRQRERISDRVHFGDHQSSTHSTVSGGGQKPVGF